MAKFKICPTCQGEGYVSKLGDFSSMDLDEQYGDDWDAREDFVSAYMTRGGAYDKHCPTCKGNRVVTKQELKEYYAALALDAEIEAERRVGA